MSVDGITQWLERNKATAIYNHRRSDWAVIVDDLTFNSDSLADAVEQARLHRRRGKYVTAGDVELWYEQTAINSGTDEEEPDWCEFAKRVNEHFERNGDGA